MGRGLAAVVGGLLCVAAAGAAEPAKPKIEWKTNLWDAYTLAVKEKKPLVVYFYADGCEWCDKMGDTLADDSVQKFADRAVFVRVNGDKDEDVKGNVGKLMTQLGVERYPTVAVVQPFPDKLVDLGRVRGYFPAEKFAPRLEQALDQATDQAAKAK